MQGESRVYTGRTLKCNEHKICMLYKFFKWHKPLHLMDIFPTE